jgi:hypothetical protein
MALSINNILRDVIRKIDASESSDTTDIYSVDLSYDTLLEQDPKLDKDTYTRLLYRLSTQYKPYTKLKTALADINKAKTILVSDKSYGTIFLSLGRSGIVSKLSAILENVGLDKKVSSSTISRVTGIVNKLPQSVATPILRELVESANITLKHSRSALNKHTIELKLVDPNTHSDSYARDAKIVAILLNAIEEDLGIRTEIAENTRDLIVDILQGRSTTKKATDSKASGNLKKQNVLKSKPPAIRTNDGRFYSLALLADLINNRLESTIAKNMGNGNFKDVLNYRTGRFADSANVVKLTQSRDGLISAFYTYMKYPYQTFEPGFNQGSPRSRDPKLLIGGAIKEIAAQKVSNRMRAVLI